MIKSLCSLDNGKLRCNSCTVYILLLTKDYIFVSWEPINTEKTANIYHYHFVPTSMEGVNGNCLFLISGKNFSFSLECHCHDYPFFSPRKHIMMYTLYSIFISRDSKQNFSTPHNFCMFSGK